RSPRVFLVRHGETEWSRAGRYTGRTDLELNKKGEEEVIRLANEKVGNGKLIDPCNVACVIVSPRKRARHTCELFLGKETTNSPKCIQSADIDEWDHGDYEGKTTEEIQAIATPAASSKCWSIWSDGCLNGESPEEVMKRVRAIINQIKQIQGPCMQGEQALDVVVVAHGTILRCFVACWL
ncbi:phosphoglycerate mutase-like protein, partial [Lizonia empirigonia]